MQLITPGEMTTVKKQLKMREDGIWSRVDWSLGKKLQPQDISIVQGRLMAMDPKVSPPPTPPLLGGVGMCWQLCEFCRGGGGSYGSSK